MSERVAWIDTLRGLGIIYVVLGHIYGGASVQTVYLFSFHVPLFFFLSGYLFNSSQYRNPGGFLLSKVKARIVPYVFFFMISYILFICKTMQVTGLGLHALLSTDDYYPMAIRAVLALAWANGEWLAKYGNVALWFLPCLFVTETLFYALFQIVRGNLRGIWPATLLFGTLGFLAGAFSKASFPWSFHVACTALVFYACGYTVRAFLKREDRIIPSSRPAKAALIITVFAASAFLSVWNGRVDMNTAVYGCYACFILTAFIGIYSHFFLSQLIGRNRLLEFLGKNTLAIFALHVPIRYYAIGFLDQVAELFTDQDIVIQNDIYVFLVTVTTLALLLPFIYLINAYFPFITGKKYRLIVTS